MWNEQKVVFWIEPTAQNGHHNLNVDQLNFLFPFKSYRQQKDKKTLPLPRLMSWFRRFSKTMRTQTKKHLAQKLLPWNSVCTINWHVCPSLPYHDPLVLGPKTQKSTKKSDLLDWVLSLFPVFCSNWLHSAMTRRNSLPVWLWGLCRKVTQS